MLLTKLFTILLTILLRTLLTILFTILLTILLTIPLKMLFTIRLRRRLTILQMSPNNPKSFFDSNFLSYNIMLGKQYLYFDFK